MADNQLIFPIGFDIETGAKAVEKQFAELNKKWSEQSSKKVEFKVGIDPNFKTYIDGLGRSSIQLKQMSAYYAELEKSTARTAKEQENAAKIAERNAKSTQRTMDMYSKLWDSIDKANKSEQNRLAILNAEERSLTNIALKLKVLRSDQKSMVFGSADYAKTEAEINRLVAKQNQMVASQKQLNAAQMQGVRASQMQNQALLTQSGLLTGLRQFANAYVSLLGATRLVDNIRQITAEFELQKVALTAIIQDQSKANQLWQQIVTLGIQSPFQIKELVSYTKQLAAYRIETDNLFDTTKRLADVSAGLGVDMGRLILAYGQVKAAAVLRGSELRQFTEAGIPLVELLAEKFSKLRGEIVSTGEVFELISTRAVSFEMVKEIFQDMTNAGGLFYNMQKKQADTLAGVWSNLRDAWDVAFSEIGRDNMGILKGTAQTLTDLASNVDKLIDVLESAAIAWGTYKIALLATSGAYKTLTLAQIFQIATEQQQLKTIPRIIALIFGETAAQKVATKVTMARTTANIGLAASNNALIRTFWRLTAAILANPYLAAGAAIIGLTTLIYKLTRNTETAEDRINNLSASVAEFTQTSEQVDELMKSYNELSKKQNKTAEEQDKLNKVIAEIGKRYPEAIKNLDEYGNAIELLTDKIENLSEAEKKRLKDIAEENYKKSEKDIEKKREELEKMRAQLMSGEIMRITPGGSFGGSISYEDKMTLNESNTLLKKIQETGDALKVMEQQANASYEALVGKKKIADAVQEFTNWQQRFKDASKTFKGISISLFNEEEIREFNTLDKALDATARKWKDYEQTIKQTEEALKANRFQMSEIAKISDKGIRSSTEAEKKELEGQLEKAKIGKELADALLVMFNALILVQTKTTGKNPRLTDLEEEVKLIEEAYKKYKDLSDAMGSTKARTEIERLYGALFKQKGITPVFDTDSYVKSLQNAANRAKALKDTKLELSLNLKASDEGVSEMKDTIKKTMSQMAREIDLQKEANQIFEKMFASTGDYTLSMDIAMSLTGIDTGNIRNTLIQQIQNAIPDIEITAEGVVDFSKVEEQIKQTESLGKEEKDNLMTILNQIRDYDKSVLDELYSSLKDFESYETKRTKIMMDAAQKRIKIDEMERSGRLTFPQAEERRTVVNTQERRQLASLDYEIFKDSDLYIKMFDNLEKASTTSLELMMKKLSELKKEADRTPTELKEISKRMEEIDAEFRSRNPFKTLIADIQNFKKNASNISMKEDLAKQAQIRYEVIKQQTEEMLKQLSILEEQLMIESRKPITQQDKDKIKKLQAEINELKKLIKLQKDSEKVAEDTANQTREQADDSKKSYEELADSITKATAEAVKLLNATSDLANTAADLVQTFGGSEADVEFFQNISKGLNDIASGATQAAQGTATLLTSLASGNIVGVVSGGISAISGLGKAIGGIFGIGNANRVKKANKEIERQRKLIVQLERDYKNLERASEDALGTDYIKNIEQQNKNLYQQQIALQKQLEAERSKGKKKDKQKMEQLEEQIIEVQNNIADNQKKVIEDMAGTSLASLAQDFAKSWLDAYLEFGDTMDAISDKFSDMIQNLIVNAIMSKIAQEQLRSTFAEIERAFQPGSEGGESLTKSELDRIVALGNAATTEIDAIYKQLMANLGQTVESMRKGDSNLTGISKDLATASEESILTVGAYLNSMLYYNVGSFNELVMIRTILETAYAVPTIESQSGEPNPFVAMTEIQNASLTELRMIQQNTFRTADACEELNSTLKSVVVPFGIKTGPFAINVNA